MQDIADCAILPSISCPEAVGYLSGPLKTQPQQRKAKKAELMALIASHVVPGDEILSFF